MTGFFCLLSVITLWADFYWLLISLQSLQVALTVRTLEKRLPDLQTITKIQRAKHLAALQMPRRFWWYVAFADVARRGGK